MRNDEPATFTVNGTEITARQLAEARQELARRSPLNIDFYPAFTELGEQDQRTSELDARNYLLALADVVPGITRRNPPAVDRG